MAIPVSLQSKMADTLREQGLYREAAATYREVLREDPHSVSATIGLGLSLRFQGEFTEARALLESIISSFPTRVEALFCLANICRAAGDASAAVHAYERVLDLEGDHAEARYYLASVSGRNPPSIPTGLVLDLFDSSAPGYDSHLVDRLQYKVPAILRQMACDLGRVGLDEMVDLGCGTGLVALRFRDLASTLVGVDLSPRMLELANERSIYDELVEGDLLTLLRSRPLGFDLEVAADVLPYLGDLEAFFSACAQALRAEGLLLFNAEIQPEDGDYHLQSTGRFAHHERYLRRLAQEAGFMERAYERAPARLEDGRPRWCHFFAFTLS